MTTPNQQKKPKILFVCKKRHDSYGVSVGLINSARFIANLLNQHGVESKVVMVRDANFIDSEVYEYKPTHVIIEALWVTPAKMEELVRIYQRRRRHVKWIVRIHSKAAFIANEGVAMDWISAYKWRLTTHYKNFFVSSNNAEFNAELNEVFDLHSVYLPNIYLPTPHDLGQPHNLDSNVIHIGCFGAVRPLKNHLLQAISAIKFGNDINKAIYFHINADRVEQGGDNVIKNLRGLFRHQRHKLIEHPWATHQDFIKMLQGIDIGMQVSLSESFNIVSGDMVSSQIPVVVSDEINWVPFIFRANPMDGEEIVSVLKFVYFTKWTGLYRINELFLKWSNFKNGRIWLGFIHQP